MRCRLRDARHLADGAAPRGRRVIARRAWRECGEKATAGERRAGVGVRLLSWGVIQGGGGGGGRRVGLSGWRIGGRVVAWAVGLGRGFRGLGERHTGGEWWGGSMRDAGLGWWC